VTRGKARRKDRRRTERRPARARPTASPPTDEARHLWLERAILVVGAFVYGWAVLYEHGTVWPDEIYQSLEMAHRLVFKFGFLPWEFQDGARSWVFPGLLSPALAVASLARGSVEAPVLFARSAMAAVSLVSLWLTMRLAGRLRGPKAAALAGILAVSFPLTILFGTRCMSEIASAPCILGAVLLLLEPTAPRRSMAAGMLLALACFFRFQNGLIAVGLFVVLLVERRGTAARWYVAGAALVGAAGGLLDYAVWGGPFHSLVAYLRFNLSGQAERYGVAPPWFYALVAWTATGPAVLVVATGLLIAARKQPALVLLLCAYLLAHAIVPHKEIRFTMPIVPLALAVAATGLVDLDEMLEARKKIKLAWGSTACAAIAMCYWAAHLTGNDIGYERIGNRSAWHFLEDYNRMLWKVGARSDLCGLSLGGTHAVWTGGYSYLHRNVPVLNEPPDTLDTIWAVNYVIAPPHVVAPPTFVEVDSQDDLRLLRRRGECAPPPPSWSATFGK
jgi:hypothetical protein